MQELVTKYKVPARVFHWLMALLVVGMIPVGFLMIDETLSRELRNTMFISHKNMGVLMLILIALRLLYRLLNPPRLRPVELPKLQEFAAHMTHIGLYALLIIMPLSGYIRVRAGGFPIKVLDSLGVPALVPRSEALAEFAKSVHYFGAYAIAALIAMHVGAALYHAVICKDGIFSLMWPIFSRESR
jgi:cytochrome b561